MVFFYRLSCFASGFLYNRQTGDEGRCSISFNILSSTAVDYSLALISYALNGTYRVIFLQIKFAFIFILHYPY